MMFFVVFGVGSSGGVNFLPVFVSGKSRILSSANFSFFPSVHVYTPFQTPLLHISASSKYVPILRSIILDSLGVLIVLYY